MALSAVRPASRNPKNHDGPAIAASIGRFGMAEQPLMDERTGRLVAGHGRLDQLTEMHAAGQDPPDGISVNPDTGEWLVPITRGWSSRSDPEAEAYLLASNQLTVLGGWDNTDLAGMLADMDPELAEIAGWSAGDVADLVKMLEPPDLDDLGEGLGDPDESDMWPVIRIKAAPHVAAAWRSHLDTHGEDESAALAALLKLDPHSPPPSDWTP